MKINFLHALGIACAVVLLAVYLSAGSAQPPASDNATSAANNTADNPLSDIKNRSYAQLDLACSLDAVDDCKPGVRITLIKFHGNSQCESCLNLGKFAESTLRKNYAAELASGVINYIDINAQAEPANELVLKYSPTHASLYLAVNRSGNESFEELSQAWYYTGDEAAYSKYLSGVIDERRN